MIDTVLFLPILLSFIIALSALPRWIKKMHFIGFVWDDMNKFSSQRKVAASGGIVVIFSFLLGALVYIFIRTFLIQGAIDITVSLFSLLTVVLMLSIIGFVDDILGWKHGGLSIQVRLFLVLCASIPLIVINAGNHLVDIPVFGLVSLGFLYPLVIIPLGIVGATTTYNFLAGFNGLEAGQGIIIVSFLSFIAYITGSRWLSVIGLCMVASLLAFYLFNRYPARVFPGDVLTYAIGSLIASMAILGNFEKIALFVFIPYVLETVLKLRGKLEKHSFGLPHPDGSVTLKYDKLYGLTHVGIFLLQKFKRKVYERDVVHFIFAFQILVCLLALAIFYGGLL